MFEFPLQENGTALHLPPVGCFGWMATHFIMGLGTCAFGFWWAGNVFGNYYDSHTGVRPFKSKLFYLSTVRALPVEPWCFVLLPGMMSLAFLITFIMNPEMTAIHHMGLLLPFVFLGLCELLTHRQVALPENLDSAMFIMAFFLKAFMTYMHLAGLPMLTTQGHSHTVLVDCCIILATLLECRNRGSVVCALVRPYLFLVEGTWMMQVAFIESACSFVTWDFMDLHVVMDQAASFTWHWLVHCCIMTLIGCCVWRYKRSVHVDFSYKKLAPELLEV